MDGKKRKKDEIKSLIAIESLVSFNSVSGIHFYVRHKLYKFPAPVHYSLLELAVNNLSPSFSCTSDSTSTPL